MAARRWPPSSEAEQLGLLRCTKAPQSSEAHWLVARLACGNQQTPRESFSFRYLALMFWLMTLTWKLRL